MTKPARARVLGLSELRRIVDAQADGQTRAARHFERMAEKAEAGDVGHPVDRFVAREVGADHVEARHEAQHLAIAVVGERALLDRRRIDSDAERFREDQRVAWASFRVASQRLRRDEADDGEAVDRLGRIDGMAARHWDSRLRRHRRAAAQNFADHAGRHAC